jgi:glycosyltransferase involved in cell wall biosynthesis
MVGAAGRNAVTLPAVSVILPAHDEAGYIGACLEALLASDLTDVVEVIVVANACTDETANVAAAFAPQAESRGWRLDVIETKEAGKLNALNLGEAEAHGDVLVYLDADVLVSQNLLRQLVEALAGTTPRYASGQPQITAKSGFGRVYARFWARLPFVSCGVPGFGIYAVNRAGRARWANFPPIISDDTFVRLQFAPSERARVEAPYTWPLVEGFANLVRVRRRQDRGVEEIAVLHPHLLCNDDDASFGVGGLLGLALRDPVGFGAYAVVKLAVKTPLGRGAGWVRGR